MEVLLTGESTGAGYEDETLTIEQTRDIWNKLSNLESSIGVVSSSVITVQGTLEHVADDFDRIEKLLGELEKILYGKGAQPSMSILTRMNSLEQKEASRENTLRWLWGIIAALIVDAARNLFGVG